MRKYVEPYKAADIILKTLKNVRPRMSEGEIGLVCKEAGAEPNHIRAGWKQLVEDGFIQIDGHLNDWFVLMGLGSEFIENGGYEKHFERVNESEKIEKERKDLIDEKTKVDLANAKRVYKTYWSTRTMAIIGAVSGAIAIFLKLAEVLGLLPLKK